MVIHSAVRSNQTEIVTYLISSYPKMKEPFTQLTADTPFHLAAQMGHLQMLKILCSSLNKECQGNEDCGLCIRNYNSDTPLHTAVKFKQEEIIDYFLTTFPHLKQLKNKRGQTAFDEAFISNNIIQHQSEEDLDLDLT